MGRFGGFRTGFAAIALVAGSVLPPSAQAAPTVPNAERHCAVTSGRDLERARPEQVGLDATAVESALEFAAGRNRFNVQIFRHNCLIGAGPSNEQSGNVAWNIWSSTKSVVSLVSGIAWDRGKLDLEAPIGRYLPAGLGDELRRSITVRNLLTETSGMRVGVFTEGITGVIPIDPNSAVQALGVPLDNPPGTTFSYSQRNVDLLSYVIELAVGEPLQRFAQRELFDPLGILPGDYYWARDRAGHTYGYAHLLIPPNDFAKIGLLVHNEGRWGARRVLSEAYLSKALAPSAANPCYGYLFWIGAGCAEIPDYLPADAYAMSGLGLQNIFVIPSLDLTVMWTGIFGNVSRYGPQGVLQNFEELPHEFFRKLMSAFPGTTDPGPYREPPVRVDPRRYFDADILLAVFGIGPSAYPGCNVFACLDYPLAPPLSGIPPGCTVLVCLGPDPRTPGIR
ncbi:serine hydrolase domain-containing protein [Nocardia goodfellowii]|uniref:CubicO group peptidase (Beta-lactamase class C family) n=1 Tax=Nocardia goodfellowii TaxID=882446 RepID=A0ABS4Q9X1_9NOCA|nr:serine hydrolase [Nocardia goodfellowii]MBP2187940.1 CubicO group peptidase (beta-lactamase class C family) [Nocardia goodfellowii]